MACAHGEEDSEMCASCYFEEVVHFYDLLFRWKEANAFWAKGVAKLK